MKKTLHLLVVGLCYIASYVGGYFSSIWISNPFLQLFFADVVATIIIYVLSLILKTSSLYDPYWSFTPIVMTVFFMIKYQAFSLSNIIVVSALAIYGLRLTINWIITFTDLSYEDWRYKRYREMFGPFMFQVVNFLGIMMFPTVLVFGGTLPILVLLEQNVDNLLSIIGAAIILLGTGLEFFADHQMHKFLRNTKEKKVCEVGLWNYSRHPNYLGENLIWLGSYVALVVALPSFWWTGYGFLLILALFFFISIPMMEKRQIARRPDYLEYKKTTSMFLILPKRKARD